MSDEKLHLPADVANTDVVSVEVTRPFKVRVTHRDGTSAVHIFRPSDFGTGTSAVLGTEAGFATAQVVELDLEVER